MNSIEKAMAASQDGMQAQSLRMRILSENIANADTHGYQRKLLSFKSTWNNVADGRAVELGRMMLDPSKGEEQFDPENPLADENGYVRLSNVNLMIELADAREASRSFEANLTIFQQAKSMYSSMLDLLRR